MTSLLIFPPLSLPLVRFGNQYQIPPYFPDLLLSIWFVFGTIDNRW